jgi:ATP-dependent RNA helicase DDX56/DBP9
MKRKLDENGEPVGSASAPETQPVNEPESKEKDLAFSDFDLDPRLLQAISSEGFKEPTLVQRKAIPLALEGKDVLAKAKTGSGKTVAYLLPVLQSILKRKQVRCSSELVAIPTGVDAN